MARLVGILLQQVPNNRLVGIPPKIFTTLVNQALPTARPEQSEASATISHLPEHLDLRIVSGADSSVQFDVG